MKPIAKTTKKVTTTAKKDAAPKGTLTKKAAARPDEKAAEKVARVPAKSAVPPARSQKTRETRAPVEKTRVVTAGAAAPRTQTRAPVEKTRVVISMDFYEPNKDAIKAPFKEHALKWNFLGEGKGLYKREDSGVHCFTQFKDDGVHYSIWGADKAVCEKILSAWRSLLGEDGWKKATTSGEAAVAAEAAQQESEALRLWKLAEPQRRPGEPDLFYGKRLTEWQAKKPA